MLCWFFILRFCFQVRNRKITELKPYLTREELWWPSLSRAALVLFGATAVLLIVAAISNLFPEIAQLIRPMPLRMSPGHTGVFLLKLICIFSLLMGTYTTNKDMFIFFKSVALERMRRRWLQSFLKERYKQMEARVAAIVQQDVSQSGDDEIVRIWEQGPSLIPVHNELKSGDAKHVWDSLIHGHEGAPGWMLDVPAITAWAARVQHSLDARDQTRKARQTDGGSSIQRTISG